MNNSAVSPYLIYSQGTPDEPGAEFDHLTSADLAERAARLSRADDDHDGPSGAIAPIGMALGAMIWVLVFVVAHMMGKI